MQTHKFGKVVIFAVRIYTPCTATSGGVTLREACLQHLFIFTPGLLLSCSNKIFGVNIVIISDNRPHIKIKETYKNKANKMGKKRRRIITDY